MRRPFMAGHGAMGSSKRYDMQPQIEFYEVFAVTDNTRGTVELFEEPVLPQATA